MSIFLTLGSELGFFSLLLGAYMDSLGFGIVILGLCALIIYPLFQHFNSLYPTLWILTLLGSFTTFLWALSIDYFFDTTFIAIFLGIMSGIIIYIVNYFFIKKYYDVLL
jgi:ABC-type multidrug transport system permease subunit